MQQKVTDKGRVVLQSIENKLGRSPSSTEMDNVEEVLTNQGLPKLSQGNNARHTFGMPNSLVSGGGVLKVPRKANDFFGSYPFQHLAVDQNIHAIYAAKHLEQDSLTPPVIDYSSEGSWVVFPVLESLKDSHKDTMVKKCAQIQEREDIRCIAGGEISGTPDIEKWDTWGIYENEVVLRDVGSILVEQQYAPELDLPPDPVWE